MSNASYTGALDIGGTKMLAGIIDDSGELVARRRIETQASRGAADVIARAAFLLRELAQEIGMAADRLTGIGTPLNARLVIDV